MGRGLLQHRPEIKLRAVFFAERFAGTPAGRRRIEAHARQRENVDRARPIAVISSASMTSEPVRQRRAGQERKSGNMSGGNQTGRLSGRGYTVAAAPHSYR